MKEVGSCAGEFQGRRVGLAGMVQEGLPEDVTLELRPAGQERTHHEKICRRKGLPGGGGPALLWERWVC